MTWSKSSAYEMAIGQKLHPSRSWDHIQRDFFSNGGAAPVLEGLTGGDQAVYAKLEARIPGLLERNARALSRHLSEMTRSRHAKFQDTFYHLAPDVKETPGGLRDLHLVGWLGKLRKLDPDAAARLAGPLVFLSSLLCFLYYHDVCDQHL